MADEAGDHCDKQPKRCHPVGMCWIPETKVLRNVPPDDVQDLMGYEVSPVVR